jgi:tetratricopeptide (TPR) repeat protein
MTLDELCATAWDFDDPVRSANRFRAAMKDPAFPDAPGARTQLARALGLQERYAEALAELDAVDAEPHLTAEARVRAALERGRVLRSSGDPDAAVEHFVAAASAAVEGGFEALHVDALHMEALVAPDPELQIARTLAALHVARSSHDQRARDWDASLLNNLGMARHDAGDDVGALAAFEQALVARLRIGDPERTRVAEWMIGWALRLLGRTDEALAVQLRLKKQLEASGSKDPFVDEELALLTGR